MELAPIYHKLAIALGLGLLVGLQRERTNARLAGFRTFPLITLLGAVCGLLSESFGGWVVAAGLVGLIGLLIVGNLPANRSKEADPGLTSEVAMLVMFAVGALLVVSQTALAITIGGTVAVLLHLKPQMHSFASRIGDRDFKAVMQFVLISLVILPVLPNQFYGPYQVLNPFKIWMMVVLIVGISLGGYLIYKLLGPRANTGSGRSRRADLQHRDYRFLRKKQKPVARSRGAGGLRDHLRISDRLCPRAGAHRRDRTWISCDCQRAYFRNARHGWGAGRLVLVHHPPRNYSHARAGKSG